MYSDLVNYYYVNGLRLKGYSIHAIHLITKVSVSKIKEFLLQGGNL